MHAQTALTTRAQSTIVIRAKSLFRGISIFFLRMPKRGRVHEDGKHGGGGRRKKAAITLLDFVAKTSKPDCDMSIFSFFPS